MTHWKAKGEHGRTAFKLSIWIKLWLQYWPEHGVYLKCIQHIHPRWCNIYSKTTLDIQYINHWTSILPASMNNSVENPCAMYIKRSKQIFKRASNLCWKRPFFKCFYKKRELAIWIYFVIHRSIHPHSQMLGHMADPSNSHLSSRVMCFLSPSCLA